MKRLAVYILILLLACLESNVSAQKNKTTSIFKQLKQELPTPNANRTASGAPGHAYWQQQADYNINIILDDQTQRIYGTETITYHNNSPDSLNYLWIQLDQNTRAKNSLAAKTITGEFSAQESFKSMDITHSDFDGGFKIEYVKSDQGKGLPYTINYTMMRIDLSSQLPPKKSFSFTIKWWYNINDRAKVGGRRSGMEYFMENDNYIYTIGQFYPRMAVYNEVEGWQNQQFLGNSEFALSFGNFDVSITVPEDHVVAATGVLQNSNMVLSNNQLDRIEKAKNSDLPIMIVTEREAIKNEKNKSNKTKTWKFRADNVRDFGFASSRKFIWDAMGISFKDRTVLAMSFYPKEGNPIWKQYSTKAVVHAIKTYSKYIFDYPYPVVQSVHTLGIGMEYPMICFAGVRPESDGTYSEKTKLRMISEIFHEVGHNYFPMIINSDERQWAWMDEGLVSFMEGIAQREWDPNWSLWKGSPVSIIDYMKGEKSNLIPIMTNPELIFNLSKNAYHKSAASLNILRNTIMGQELFDFAFKQYAQRWKFKHATPADFFRTMEDASAVDLDWFWRGWYYTTDHVDISLDEVKIFTMNTMDPKTGHVSYYQLSFSNLGGIIMPIILEFTFTDGTKKLERIPVEIWLRHEAQVTKVFPFHKIVANITLDPYLETADVDTGNNHWSPKPEVNNLN